MKRIYLIVVLLFLIAGTTLADEGMWLPSLIHKLNMKEMKSLGCELTAEDIYSINNSSLKDAVVALNRGSCTAELVSKDGLLLTNHHCGFGDIQSHSTVENDYLKDGFWAQSHDEELPNPGKTVSFLIRVEDVTEKILAQVSDSLDYYSSMNEIRRISGEISREATKDTHYDANVRSLFNDNRYYLFVYETFTDIRLVGCPPASIGKFGGDTDNWMWPRHTGDFCIFRVYTGPDGKPAEYSEENIPLHPRHYLPISLKGIEEGDFAMVLGYPGRTQRYKTSTGVNFTMEVTNTARREARGVKLAIIKDYMKTSPAARIQYASKHAGSSNYYKFSIGQNKGLENLNVIEKKKNIEEDFLAWANANPERSEKYGEALDLIAQGYSDLNSSIARAYMSETMTRGPEVFGFANRARVIERMLDSKDFDQEKFDKVIERYKESINSYFKNYNALTDQKVVAALLKVYHDKVSPEYYPSFFEEIQKKYKGDFDKYAAKMFAKTIFADKNKLEAFLEKPSLKVLRKDKAYQATQSIFEKYGQINEVASETTPMLSKGRQLYLAGLMEMDKNRNFYPDANSTMRLTYGNVLDYVPRDGVLYNYFTTVNGYLEKEIPGDIEFDVKPEMKELILKKDFGRYADADGELHTCFLTNNDITGGNSGSPVVNGKGELVGIAFDGNWEAMSGDIAFEPDLQRCINVDIRFVLWVIDKYAGASHLIDEMTIAE